MKTIVLMAALVASAALIAPAQAGNGHHSGGGGFVAPARGGGAPSFRSMPAGRFGAAPSFRSMPMRSFSGNRTVYSGQGFSSAGARSPRMTEFGSRPLNSNMSAGRQFTGGNAGINRTNQFRNNQRVVQNGGGLPRNNNAIGNRTGGQFRNGNRLAPNWRNHVVAQHSANWHRDWDRHRDHFFHGNRFVFIDGFWWGFGLGFDPWLWWDYPYYGYGYGYGYPYNYGYYPNGYGDGYGYGYNDPGDYNDQPGYDNGYNDQSRYQQNGYGDRSANSSVAAAQDRLTQEGFYRGQIDGVLGPETRHAIVRFQTKHGLGISGELTPETLNAMGLRQYANY
ncbi:MAG TPA: peptidoglycan-binding domain-containing protein [Chthoniobacterales bacterium]|nr:peptidoglycan-binding domain-containing protein [Chthoniobacterales bacterium]